MPVVTSPLALAVTSEVSLEIAKYPLGSKIVFSSEPLP